MATKIYDWDDFKAMSLAPDGDYELANDLDENTDGYTENIAPIAKWTCSNPVYTDYEACIANSGTWDLTPFSGTFDGKNFSVKYVQITLDEGMDNMSGLFHTITGTVKNLKIVDCDARSLGFSAVLAYSVDGGTVENVHIIRAGGTGTTGLAGGAGLACLAINGASISRCSVIDSTIGGIALMQPVAGFILTTDGSAITNCFVQNVSIEGRAICAGFIYNSLGSIVNKCYSAASFVTGDPPANDSGFVYTGTELLITNCFYDFELWDGAGTTYGTPKSTESMKQVETFTHEYDSGPPVSGSIGLVEAWDFINDPYDDVGSDNIWRIYSGNNGYPCFALPVKRQTFIL